MKTVMKWLAVAVVVMFPVAAAIGQDRTAGTEEKKEAVKTLRVTTANEDVFVVTHPEGWKATVERPAADFPPTVRIEAGEGVKMSMLMTFIPQRAEQPIETQEQAETVIRGTSRRYVGGSVEKKVELKKIERGEGEGVGAYAQFTDASLVDKEAGPTEYKVVATGVVASGKTLVAVTLLADRFDDPAYVRGLELLSRGIELEK